VIRAESDLHSAINDLNAQCVSLGLLPLDREQVELLFNARRKSPEAEDVDEAKGMLDDLEARCGLNVENVRAAIATADNQRGE
jgi:hypothetical protein